MLGIPSPWLILGVVLAIGGAGATGYIRGHSDGTGKADAKWEHAIAQQKDEARALLDAETARVRAKESELAALSNKVETEHVEATNALAAGRAKYDRLGSLYERTKARCGSGGSSSPGPDPGTPAVDHGGEGQPADVPGADAEDLGAVIADADLMRVTVLACQEWVRGMR